MISSIEQIISGGQTGADRAALDWAINSQIKHGGWCPKGRLSEDGYIPLKYQLLETQSFDYAIRTESNIRDSDATAIFSHDEHIINGTALTKTLATKLCKPWLHVCAIMGIKLAAHHLELFILQNDVKILNVAGSRASEEPEVYNFVIEVLNTAFN
jgi:Circularly permutated YpsA SLOG family